MKKLFFTALVAIVAVGGAYATKAKLFQTGIFYSISALDPDIFCTEGQSVCSMYYSGPAFDKPADDPTRVEVDLSAYEHPL